MKHARTDYSHIQDKKRNIPADEPVFLLRGQDKHSIETLKFYISRVKQERDWDKVLVTNLEGHIKEIKKWQETVAVKLPDMPASAMR